MQNIIITTIRKLGNSYDYIGETNYFLIHLLYIEFMSIMLLMGVTI